MHLISFGFLFRFYIESISYLKDNATIELFFLNAKSCIYKVRTLRAMDGSEGGLRPNLRWLQNCMPTAWSEKQAVIQLSCSRGQPSGRQSGVLSVSRPKRAAAAARDADGRHLLGWGMRNACDRVRKWGCSCGLCTCVRKLWGCVCTCVCMSVCEGRGVWWRVAVCVCVMLWEGFPAQPPAATSQQCVSDCSDNRFTPNPGPHLLISMCPKIQDYLCMSKCRVR